MSTGTTPSTHDTTPRPKAVLFCPECDHESHLGGDWIVDERPDRTTYECPDCGTTVTTRQRHALAAR